MGISVTIHNTEKCTHIGYNLFGGGSRTELKEKGDHTYL
jgi:hypothetical protein